MKILVINGDCLTTNSSANLCHLAYINGLLDLGHSVDLISAGASGRKVDSTMEIPKGVKAYTFNGISLYERGSQVIKNNSEKQPQSKNNNQKRTIKSILYSKIKATIRSFYGVYGMYKPFMKQAVKFKSPEVYDYVISVSTPPCSHYIAHLLIKKGNVKAKKWIQIWEDPWYADIYGGSHTKQCFNAEKKLLHYADAVCYVSPLTLENQKTFFPEYADKMYWQPLPSYYKQEDRVDLDQELNYGYFGDYVPAARNLEPFYKAALKNHITVNICGTPHTLFEPTENIHIYPRLPLDKLKPIEDNTQVLVFLCNRTGGQIPGKIYQYSATNKVVLFILDGTQKEKDILKAYFSNFNRYVFCENTVEDISDAMNKIGNHNFDGIENVALDYFSPKHIVRNILLGKA